MSKELPKPLNTNEEYLHSIAKSLQDIYSKLNSLDKASEPTPKKQAPTRKKTPQKKVSTNESK